METLIDLYYIILYIPVNLIPVSITAYRPGIVEPDSRAVADNIILTIPGNSLLKSIQF